MAVILQDWLDVAVKRHGSRLLRFWLVAYELAAYCLEVLVLNLFSRKDLLYRLRGVVGLRYIESCCAILVLVVYRAEVAKH